MLAHNKNPLTLKSVPHTEIGSFQELPRGSVQHYLLSVPSSLGCLEYIRIWHDNSGKGSQGSWYLESIVVKDIQTDERYMPVYILHHIAV